MARRPSKLEESILAHSLRLLAGRRFELYDRITPRLTELEEAITETNVRRIIETFAELRRALQQSIAYLSRPVYRVLRGMEIAMEAGLDAAGGVDLDRLRLEILKMHVEFGRAIQNPVFEPVEEILDLDVGTKVRLREGARAGPAGRPDDLMGQALEIARKGWIDLSAKRYKRAVKSFRRAIELLPAVPRFRGDLAIALLLTGEADEAVAEARTALEAYARDQVGEGSERRIARRTLGRALRAVAEKKFQARHLDGAVMDLRRALDELEASLDGEPEGVERLEVRGEIVKSEERLSQWEEIWRKISGFPEAQVPAPPSDRNP